MHILLISHYWEPEEGVPQRRLAWITRVLNQSGHKVTALAPPPHYPFGNLLSEDPKYRPGSIAKGPNGATIYRCNFREHTSRLSGRGADQAAVAFSQLRLLRRVFKDARRQGKPFDLVLCTVPALPSAFVAYVAARWQHIPYLVDLRDSWPELLNQMTKWPDWQTTFSFRALRNKVLFWACVTFISPIINMLLTSANGCISTTESLAGHLERKGVPNTLVLRNRVHIEPTVLAPVPLQARPLRVLYSGTVGRAQGLEAAIRAAATATQRGAKIELRVVGGGAHKKTLEHNAQKLGLNVTFMPRCPLSEVIEHYRWCDTILVSLQDWEPLEWSVPSKLYEAMSVGRHISCIANGEAAHLVVSQGAGDSVSAQDEHALAALWGRLYLERERLHVGGKARRWVEAELDQGNNAHNLLSFLSKHATRSDEVF